MIYIGNGIYSDATPNEYLAHYGVLGMKWGVRKAANQAIGREQQLSWARQRYYKRKYKAGEIDKPTYKMLKRNTIANYRTRKNKIKAGKHLSLSSGKYDKKFTEDSKNRYYTAFGKDVDARDRRNQILNRVGYGVGLGGVGVSLASQLMRDRETADRLNSVGKMVQLGGLTTQAVALRKHNRELDSKYNNNYDRKSNKKRR